MLWKIFAIHIVLDVEVLPSHLIKQIYTLSSYRWSSWNDGQYGDL